MMILHAWLQATGSGTVGGHQTLYTGKNNTKIAIWGTKSLSNIANVAGGCMISGFFY